jgi:hypothetical protein
MLGLIFTLDIEKRKDNIGHSVAIFRSLRLGSSDYTFGIFWLCLWYLLITPFGIFWLQLWYHLITPLVSSDHSSGIFWRYQWSDQKSEEPKRSELKIATECPMEPRTQSENTKGVIIEEQINRGELNQSYVTC